MVKLFFTVLAGYAIFLGLMAMQIITPLINSIDSQLGGGTLRMVVPPDSPIPAGVAQFIDNHPQLVLRACEGAVVVLIAWSAMLLLTHWGRQLSGMLRARHQRRAMAASHRLAAMVARSHDSWV